MEPTLEVDCLDEYKGLVGYSYALYLRNRILWVNRPNDAVTEYIQWCQSLEETKKLLETHSYDEEAARVPTKVSQSGNLFFYLVDCMNGLGSIQQRCGKFGVCTRPRGRYPLKYHHFIKLEETTEQVACFAEYLLRDELSDESYMLYSESFRIEALEQVVVSWEKCLNLAKGRLRIPDEATE